MPRTHKRAAAFQASATTKKIKINLASVIESHYQRYQQIFTEQSSIAHQKYGIQLEHLQRYIFELIKDNQIDEFIDLIVQEENDHQCQIFFNRLDEPFDPDAILNLKDENGNTPLHNAVINGYWEFVGRILEFSPMVLIRNNEGKTALDILQEKDNINDLLLIKAQIELFEDRFEKYMRFIHYIEQLESNNKKCSLEYIIALLVLDGLTALNYEHGNYESNGYFRVPPRHLYAFLDEHISPESKGHLFSLNDALHKNACKLAQTCILDQVFERKNDDATLAEAVKHYAKDLSSTIKVNIEMTFEQIFDDLLRYLARHAEARIFTPNELLEHPKFSVLQKAYDSNISSIVIDVCRSYLIDNKMAPWASSIKSFREVYQREYSNETSMLIQASVAGLLLYGKEDRQANRDEFYRRNLERPPSPLKNCMVKA